jgi:PAS domain-containing protein/anti-sigma regulatory factor (Ser/Thr protein kinase)
VRKSERERLQVALDAAGMGTFVWYAREDRTEPDARMLELFALPANGVLSLATALDSMLHPDDKQRYNTAVTAAFDPDGNHLLSQEIRVDRGDGTYRWVAVTARAFFAGKPPQPDRLVGVAADITRRREIEDELRSSEERRTFLLDLTDDMRLVTDPVSVQALAVEALGTRLAVSRAMYLEVSDSGAGDAYTVERDYHVSGTPSAVGRYQADDFGATLFDELRAGRTLTVADVATDPRLTPAERLGYERIDIAAFAAVPLIKDGRHAAALVLHEATVRQWEDDDLALVEEVAERTWAAVERGRAEVALRESEARFRQVVEVSPQLIWVARGDGAIEMLNPSWSALVAGPPAPAGTDRALLGHIVHPDERDGFLRAWDAARAAGADFEREARLRQRWYLIRVVGSRTGLGAVVNWFGVATDIDEQRRAGDLALAEQTLARDQEHRIAVELQRALLPARTVDAPGVAIAAKYEAGSTNLEVGGDWYDTFELPGGGIALTVGDVVGHGLSAATTMGKMRVAMGALAPHADGPGSLLTYLDGFAAGNDEIEFVTACYAVVDPATRELRHASAGHLPMLVVAADGRSRWLQDGRSAPITGKDLGMRPEAGEVLAPGDLLVLFSDGLIERRREALTTGLDRLEEAVVARRNAPVDEICAGLLTALGVADHRNDDVVVLCMRVATGPFHRTITSDRGELSRLRRALQAWWPGGRDESDLLIAVNEACANAIEHAYLNAPDGVIEVDVGPEPDGTLLVTIRDFGTWRPPAGTPGDRGRGLEIIGRLSHDFERHSSAGGTVFRFRMPTEDATR